MLDFESVAIIAEQAQSEIDRLRDSLLKIVGVYEQAKSIDALQNACFEMYKIAEEALQS